MILVLSDEELKAKLKERQSTPEYKAYHKEWELRPESKARRKERRATEEYKVVRRKRRATPENKAKARERERTPKHKAWRKERRATPEYMAKSKAFKLKPENKAKSKARKLKPDYKAQQKERVDNIRLKVLQYYSKHLSNSDIPCCWCCEESHIEFLALDHIAGRKEMDSESGLVKLGYSSSMVKTVLSNWIIKNNFPKGFQILCHNCNQAKAVYGKCPHEKSQ